MLHVENRTAEEEVLTHPKYRADIDGLRAIAVLSVMAFHAFPEWVRGGFIGVDIFFVISGFLISTIIFKSLVSNEFSFAEFYSRRVRRIFPALITVLLTAFFIGWFVLYPDEYRQLGKHIIGGAGFVSNFVLWRESGYFDTVAETKPLLHLWSLGIEEQFYIVFPLFVWLLWKLRLNVLTFVVLFGAVSFLLNLKSIYTDAVWTFYMPQTRIWELLIGSVLAWVVLDFSGVVARIESATGKFVYRLIYQQTATISIKSMLSNAKAFVGILLLTVGLWKITKEVHFPGKWALLPTVGAALMIWAGPQALVNRWLLSNRILVWIGKISYPLYLWHWLFLTYARILASEPPPIWARWSALALSIVLSWLTYRLIEQPLRFGGHGRRKTLVLILAMTLVASLGFATYKSDGFSSARAKMDASGGVKQFAWDYMGNDACVSRVKSQPGFCMLLGNPNNITIAILGDSTANALVPGVAELVASHGDGVLNIGHGACPPIRGLVPTDTWGAKPNCPAIVEEAYKIILKDRNIKTVILGFFTHDMQYYGFKDLPTDSSIEKRIEKTMELLDADIHALQAAGKKIIVTYDAAYSPRTSKDCLRRPMSGLFKDDRQCVITEDQVIDRYPYLTILDKHFRLNPNVCIFKQSDLLFTDGKLNLVAQDGHVILRDSHHLSVYGSEQMARLLAASNCAKDLPWEH